MICFVICKADFLLFTMSQVKLHACMKRFIWLMYNHEEEAKRILNDLRSEYRVGVSLLDYSDKPSGALLEFR